MTHYPYNQWVALLEIAGVMLVITGLPGLFLVIKLWNRKWPGKVAAGGVSVAWLVSYPKAVWLMFRHGDLQREAARRHDCLGYANSMPDRCSDVLMAPSVQPQGLLFWSAIILAIGFAGIFVMSAPELIGWVRSVRLEIARRIE